MSSRLGNPQPFFPKGPALSERAQLGMARRRARHGSARRAGRPTEALVAPLPVEERHGLPEVVDRPTIVALGLVGSAEVAVRQRLQDDLPAGRGEREGALAGGDGLVMRPTSVEMERQKARDLSQPTRVVEGRREGLGLAQSRQDPPQSPDGESAVRRASRRSMACSRVSRCSGRCWKGTECLLEVPHGLAVGRLRHSLLPSLPAVCQGLVPHLTPQGMVGQALNLLGHPVPSRALRGPQRCGHAAPAAAPGAGRRRPLRGSGRA